MSNPTPALPAAPSAVNPPAFSPADAREVAEILQPFTTCRAAFIRAVASGDNPTTAAKVAGYASMAKLTGKRLLNDPAVSRAIEALRDVLANQALFDFEMAHNTMLAALDFARQTGNAMAVVKAAETLAKLHGHLTDKLDVSAKGDVAFVFPAFAPKPEPMTIEAGDAE